MKQNKTNKKKEKNIFNTLQDGLHWVKVNTTVPYFLESKQKK